MIKALMGANDNENDNLTMESEMCDADILDLLSWVNHYWHHGTEMEK